MSRSTSSVTGVERLENLEFRHCPLTVSYTPKEWVTLIDPTVDRKSCCSPESVSLSSLSLGTSLTLLQIKNLHKKGKL